MFSLPWLKFVQGWLFSALVGVTFLTALAHYLWGGIRPQAPGFVEKVTPQVKAHLSVLLGLIVLTKAWGYYLGRFDLLTSTRGVVVGASYTDVNAQLPALRILVVIAIACAILFLVNIRLRGWALPVIAVGLLALVSIIAGAAYPAFVQRFRVAPQEFQREEPYIDGQHRGDATRVLARRDPEQLAPDRGRRSERGGRARTRRRSRTSACGAPTSCATTTTRCSGSARTTSSTTSTSTGTSSTGSGGS